jgi:T5orf172 domain-containing protein
MVDMSRSHHVYIATDGVLFKIGRTNDVRRRCKFRDMRPVCSWWCPDLAQDIELSIRRTLRRRRANRSSHEWFNVSWKKMFETVLATIRSYYFMDEMPTRTDYAVAKAFGISTSLINNRLPGGREAYVKRRK